MKTNQKGFSVVEILIVVVVVSFIGAAGWLIYDREKSNKSTETTPTNTSQTTDTETETAKTTDTADETVNWKTHTRYGVTYKYPNDWGIKENNSSQSTATYITSPDYSATNEVTKGQSVTVDSAEFTPIGLNAENFKALHLDSNPNSYSDYKILTVNGKKAVQFYRGDSRTTVFFLDNNKTVTFVLDTFPDRAASSSVYDKIIGTVTAN